MLGLTSVQALQNFVDIRKHSCTDGHPSLTPGTANTAKSVGTRRFPACHTQGLTLCLEKIAVTNEVIFLHKCMLSALIFCE